MNNRKLVFSALFVVCIVVAIWWMSLHGDGQKNLTQQVSSSVQIPKPVLDPPPKKNIPVSSKNEKELQEFRTARKRDSERIESAVKEVFNAKIAFYGKVVDEHGAPIAGATTSYNISTGSIRDDPTQSGPKTDSAGRFSVTGKRGARLAVEVEHPDYYKTELHGSFFSYGGPVASDSTPLPTVDNPAVFVLHRKGKAEPLIQHNFQMRMSTNGVPLNLDLRRGTVGSSSESIVLLLTSEGGKIPLNHYYPFNWKLTIQAQNGGMQERIDRFQFQAPVEGYQQEASYSKSAALPRNQWTGTFDKEFFVLLPSGTHARIQIHVATKNGSCEIQSFLNPIPSDLNLEYDPALQSAPR